MYIVITCLSVICFAASARGEWLNDQADIMGTRINVELWSEDIDRGKSIINRVFDSMRQVDQQLSPYIASSELSRVNNSAAKSEVPISDSLFRLIERSMYFSSLTDGAFDITFASVGFHYDYRNKVKPSDSQREQLKSAIDYRYVVLSQENKSVSFEDPRVKIDLGGIAKGYAVDEAISILKSAGIEYAVVSAGGDSRFLGDRRGKPWIVGIKNPRKKHGNALVIPLSDTAISTSGDYERYFMDEDGRRIHHILNPHTAQSATGIASVSIIGPSGFDTDPLSTSVFVLGVEKGLSLLNKMPDFDGVIIDSTGKVHYSSGLVDPNL